MRIVVDARISRTWDAGVGRYTLSLLNALRPFGHDVVLVTNARGDARPRAAGHAGGTIVPSAIAIASGGQHTALPLLYRRLAADVVLTTHPLAAPLCSPCPLVAVVVDVYPLHFPDQF